MTNMTKMLFPGALVLAALAFLLPAAAMPDGFRAFALIGLGRSEERRVGKYCKYRW